MKLVKRFYVDTNVWLDFALDRKDGIRPLGELAFQFFKKCIRNRWRILYSGLVVEELGRKLSPKEIMESCFHIVASEGLLKKVELPLEKEQEARRISKYEKVPLADATHALIAKHNKAVVVSRDFHFNVLAKIVKVALPEEI